MSEILLQAIVEKLEALEIALLKQGSAGKDEEASKELTSAVKSIQLELIKFSSASNANYEKINDLSEEIHVLRLNSGNPIQNQVKHTHHFHKQVWVSISLFIITLLLAHGWINCSNEKKSFEANDMKYRFWKANGNRHLLNIVYYTDSLYTVDKDRFIQQVVLAEHQVVEQEKAHRLAGEKKKGEKK
jgi:hypothetical protein